jgi:Mg/Co/Ni transporter MgtE
MKTKIQVTLSKEKWVSIMALLFTEDNIELAREIEEQVKKNELKSLTNHENKS